MNKQYIYLSALFILLGAGLVFLQDGQVSRETPPEQVLASLNEPFRFVSTDDVASRIISRDPALLLIDVREPSEYNGFSLDGALNIPLSRLLDKDFQSILGRKGFDVVFYSNGDIRAENAWILYSRLGMKKMYIMRGGLNTWIETILNPTPPASSASSTDWEQYDFRRAARMYFTGEGVIIKPGEAAAPEKKAAVPKKALPPPVPASDHSDEGC